MLAANSLAVTASTALASRALSKAADHCKRCVGGDRMDWKTLRSRGLVALLVGALVAVGCGSSDKGTTTPTGTADSAVVPDVAADVEAPDMAVDSAVPDVAAEDVQPLPDMAGADNGPTPDAAPDIATTDNGPSDTGSCSEGGCPCSENAQCQSGYCLDDAGTGQCATPCAAAA